MKGLKSVLRDLTKAITLTSRREKKSFVEKNANTILIIITLISLGISIFFSISALEQTRFATNISYKQYVDVIRNRKIDSIRFVKSALKDSISELQQVKRNSYQDSINKKQLIAISIQAKSAEKILALQNKAYFQQLINEQPKFTVLSAFLDVIKNDTSASFIIKNTGIRPTATNRKRLLGWNQKYNYFKTVISEGRTIMDKEENVQIDLPISKNVFNDEETLYYLKIEYKDVLNPKKKSYEFYFKKTINKLGFFVIQQLRPVEEVEIVRRLKLHTNIDKLVNAYGF